MLVGKSCLRECIFLERVTNRRTVRVLQRLGCRAASSRSQDSTAGGASSQTSTEEVTTAPSNGSSSQPKQDVYLQQEQQQRPPSPAVQTLQQTAPLLIQQQRQQQQLQQHHHHHQQLLQQHKRRQYHPHNPFHKPEHRQLHPQPALQQAPMQQFELVSEKAVHQRYLSVFDRRVRFCAPEHPSECRVLDFDVVGHPRANFCFAVTFPFHPNKDGSKSGEVTLIREYAQGPNALMYCLPTGGLDPRRHADLAECAARELSEEAWLTGGTWHRLLAPDHPGLPEVKWCMNRFVPFLVVDPELDPSPGSRDAEEASMEVIRVPLPEFKRLMVSGEMLLPSITTAYMALDKLKEEGLVD